MLTVRLKTRDCYEMIVDEAKGKFPVIKVTISNYFLRNVKPRQEPITSSLNAHNKPMQRHFYRPVYF